MKNAPLIALVLLLFAAAPLFATAQKLSKKEIATIEKAEQARLDSVRHVKALNAIESSNWAFESDHLTDSNGRIINAPNPRPNVFCFDGVRFYGTFLLSAGQGIVGCRIESNGKLISRTINKKGEAIFRFESVAPTRSECTVTLSADSDDATLYISADQGSATYMGRLMPASESRYVMKTEYGK